jgi:hypothetical protein
LFPGCIVTFVDKDIDEEDVFKMGQPLSTERTAITTIGGFQLKDERDVDLEENIFVKKSFPTLKS